MNKVRLYILEIKLEVLFSEERSDEENNNILFPEERSDEGNNSILFPEERSDEGNKDSSDWGEISILYSQCMSYCLIPFQRDSSATKYLS